MVFSLFDWIGLSFVPLLATLASTFDGFDFSFIFLADEKQAVCFASISVYLCAVYLLGFFGFPVFITR